MLTTVRRRLAREDGLTLIEVLFAIAIAGVLGGAIVGGLAQANQAAARSQNRITALAELQTTAHRITREVRAANPITVASANEAAATVVRAGQTRAYRYRLVLDTATTYRIEEVRTVAGAPTTNVIARGLGATGLVFRYFDGTGAELSPPITGGDLALIRTVRVTLTRFIPLNTAPITLETTVDVRNQA